MDGQMDIYDFMQPQEHTCKTCCWIREDKCMWLRYHRDDKAYINGNCYRWRPNTTLFKCCATCKYSNNYEYEGEQDNPVEEPNIYCTHKDGSLNRHCRWSDKVQKGFGVGTWHRQHEYDLCDRWELDVFWSNKCERL